MHAQYANGRKEKRTYGKSGLPPQNDEIVSKLKLRSTKSESCSPERYKYDRVKKKNRELKKDINYAQEGLESNPRLLSDTKTRNNLHEPNRKILLRKLYTQRTLSTVLWFLLKMS